MMIHNYNIFSPLCRMGQTLLCGSVWFAVVALGLSSCHPDEPENLAPLHLGSLGNTIMTTDRPSGAPMYLPAATNDATPGSFIPGNETGVPSFLPYNLLYPLPINPEYTTIGCFLVEATADGPINSISGYFKYLEDNTWSTTVGVKPVDYYMFGYMPSNISGMSVSVAKRTGAGSTGSWADGCVMTLANLSTVTPADVCVVVGVLKGTADKYDINDPLNIVPNIHQGVYSYEGSDENNYVYLLLDHLYTNVNLELSVDPAYAALRTIVLKKVLMKSSVTNTVDAVVTLGNSHVTPIERIDFTQSPDGESVEAVLFPESGQFARAISNDPAHPTSVPGYFAPGMTTQTFDFEFVYDVYDKEGEDLSDPENPIYGNLVRKDAHAINQWSLTGESVSSGKSYKLKVGIQPTYLYQLSDPDLDNPSITLEVQ